jgi:hypothetical protein
MDASRLLEVLNDVAAEFLGGYVKLLQAVVQAYTQARDAPTQDFSVQIAAAQKNLTDHFARSVFTDYPPSKQHILAAIGGLGVIGESAGDALSSRLSAAGLTGAALVAAATEFVSEVEAFRKACAKTEAGLESLGIRQHSLEPNECEVGVLIPRNITSGTLVGLRDQLNEWNTILKGFSELAGEIEREIPLKGLATGSDEFYVGVAILTAKLLAYAIDKVLEWYKKILEIQEMRLKMASLGAPVAEIAAIKKHEKELLDQATKDIIQDVMEQSKTKLASARKSEIENQLTISIRYIARFVDKGGDVEVNVGVPVVPEEPTVPSAEENAVPETKNEYLQKKKEYDSLSASATEAREISRKGAALGSLPPRPTPILQLGDGGEVDESDSAKAKKK